MCVRLLERSHATLELSRGEPTPIQPEVEVQPHDEEHEEHEEHEERKPHPAPEQRPEEPRPGFATGQQQEPEIPEDEREPDFARGQDIEPEPGTEKHGRFSTGQEERDD